jgi:hypothetical protein
MVRRPVEQIETTAYKTVTVNVNFHLVAAECQA